MENQDSCSTLVEKSKEVLFENQNHQLEVDGVIYRELKTLYRGVIQDGPDTGKEEQVLVHTLSMGDKSYTVLKTNQQILEVTQANKMNSLELATFQEVWEEHKMTFKEAFVI